MSRARRWMIAPALAVALVALSAQPAGATTTPRRDLSQTDFDASFVRLASGPGRGLVALWREKHGDDWRLYASASDEGPDALGPPSPLSSPGGDARDAQAAVAANGTSLVIWNSSEGGHQTIKASTRAPGQGWSAPQNVSVPGTDAYHAQVAMGRGGSAVAAWSRSDGTRNVIQAAVLPAGGAWGKTADLTDAANVTRNPQVAIGGDGTAVAVWERSNGDYSSIQASVLAPGGAWSAPARLSVPGGNATSARVAMDEAGDALAIWRWYDGIDWIVASSFRPVGQDWQRVREVSVPGVSASPPALAMNGSGRAVAIWTEPTGVWSAQFGTDDRWARERTVDVTRGNTRSPSVAINGTGDETALWVAGGSVYGAFRTADADRWDDSQQVDCQSPDADICFSSYQPRTLITGPGKAFAVWLESRNDHEVLASAAYDNTTPPDTTGASSDEELSADGNADTGVVVERTSPLLAGRRIRVTIHCPATRPCRGHLVLRRAPGLRALAGRSLRIFPGRSTVLLLRLTGLPRSVLLRGARLRTHISIERVRRGRQSVASSHSLVIVGRFTPLPTGAKPRIR